MIKCYPMKKIQFCAVIFLLTILTAFSQESKNYKIKCNIDKSFNKYQYDFKYLTQLCDSTFPKTNETFSRNIQSEMQKLILNRLGKPDVNDIIFSIQCKKYLAKFSNQHTNIQQKIENPNFYPFIIYPHQGKLYLNNIDKSIDSTHIGKEITALNNIAITNIIAEFKNIAMAENEISKINSLRVNREFMVPENYSELNIFKQDSLKITFNDGKFCTISKLQSKDINFYKIIAKPNNITNKDLQKRPYTYSFYNDVAYLQFNACMDKQAMLDGINDYVPPLFRGKARNILEKQYKLDIEKQDERVVGNINKDFPLFKDFLEDLFNKLKKNNTNKLIIDLRNNNGGEERLGLQLLYYLTENEHLKNFKSYIYPTNVFKFYFERDYLRYEDKYKLDNNGKLPPKGIALFEKKEVFEEITNPNSNYFINPKRNVFKGKVVVLANHNTASAAALLTTLIQDNNLGTIIGTSVSNNPTGETQFTPFELPKTKAKVTIASMYLERPDSTKGDVQIPDYWIEKTFLDALNGKDPLYEKALKL